MSTEYRMVVKRPELNDPKTEAQALVNTCRPTEGNNDLRKYVTLLMVCLWVSVAFLSSLGLATEPAWFSELGYLIAIIFGRMWQIESSTIEENKT